jgi:hypothetical protein
VSSWARVRQAAQRSCHAIVSVLTAVMIILTGAASTEHQETPSMPSIVVVANPPQHGQTPLLPPRHDGILFVAYIAEENPPQEDPGTDGAEGFVDDDSPPQVDT